MANIDAILDDCLPTCLSNEGRSVYLRDPATGENYPVVQGADWTAAERERRRLRRIVCGIVGKVMQEYLR